MKLKSRIKKALFSFFQEEITSYVLNKYSSVKMVYTNPKMARIEVPILFDIKNEDRHEIIPGYVTYERQLNKARKMLFEEAIKYAVIDNSSVLDENLFDKRMIRVSLLVGIQEQTNNN